MTDKETLYAHRLKQAEETLLDAERMLQGSFSPRSIINRAYYSMFYAVLALFLKTGVNIKTSKHIGVISMFDREFVKTGKIDKHYSKILHDVFDARQESDYKEFVELSYEDADGFVKLAKEFLDGMKKAM
ncbi:MAG: HEPN domain-containing protein [Deltaproteobacteria bacterium]|nr:HEPN domain-containing protein [Deltaproteobacteria bacterium]